MLVFSCSPPLDRWPDGVQEIRYQSNIDKTLQPALFYDPEVNSKRPLLVALHTWSGDYKQTGGEIKYVKWCINNEWYFVHPNFRGPNKTPEALGSEFVVSDIASVVEYMKENHSINEDRIYLIGMSGGAHAALLMAGRRPRLWAGVSAWCGISDICQWYEEVSKKDKFTKHIESALSGQPGIDSIPTIECIKRSPLTYLNNAKSVNLDINAGVQDGRKGPVPFVHSLIAFNKVAKKEDIIPNKDINYFYVKKVPLFYRDISKQSYGSRKILFRKISNNVRVTIFEGEHEIFHHQALSWLKLQQRNKLANWSSIN